VESDPPGTGRGAISPTPLPNRLLGTAIVGRALYIRYRILRFPDRPPRAGRRPSCGGQRGGPVAADTDDPIAGLRPLAHLCVLRARGVDDRLSPVWCADLILKAPPLPPHMCTKII